MRFPSAFTPPPEAVRLHEQKQTAAVEAEAKPKPETVPAQACHACEAVGIRASAPEGSDLPLCSSCAKAWKMGYRTGAEIGAGDLIDAANAVVAGRVPAVSAELEGSNWKHSRISDSLTDRLASAVSKLGSDPENALNAVSVRSFDLGRVAGAAEERRVVAAWLRGFGSFQPALTGSDLARRVECCVPWDDEKRRRALLPDKPASIDEAPLRVRVNGRVGLLVSRTRSLLATTGWTTSWVLFDDAILPVEVHTSSVIDHRDLPPADPKGHCAMAAHAWLARFWHRHGEAVFTPTLESLTEAMRDVHIRSYDMGWRDSVNVLVDADSVSERRDVGLALASEADPERFASWLERRAKASLPADENAAILLTTIAAAVRCGELDAS